MPYRNALVCLLVVPVLGMLGACSDDDKATPQVIFDGQLQVGEKDVHIAIDLPFLLRAMKGTIESKVREKLEKSLG